METTKVALIGFGTIGTGVAKILLEHADRMQKRTGRKVELTHVVDLDLTTDRGVSMPEGVLTDDLQRVLDDKEVTVAVQLIGGTDQARTVMLQLLESGKDVVTANKALLAQHGEELFERARELGQSIAFEAAVAGGIPIIAAIGQSLAANQFLSIHAILNGTCNFILTEMEEKGINYSEVVAEAQRLGYAEADPTMDVDGTDAAQKLTILAQLAFGAVVDWKEIPRIGVDQVDLDDMHYADELGYAIRLLAIAHLSDAGLELHVSPALVEKGTLLADVKGAFNAIRVIGDAVGRVFFQGLGAGQDPTASAVVGDLIDTIVGRAQLTFKTSNLWSSENGRAPVRDPNEIEGCYYMRFNVDDRPGVMAELTGVLGSHGISIASVIQHDVGRCSVPLVIMTHRASAGAVASAFAKIKSLDCVHDDSVCLRVHERPE